MSVKSWRCAFCIVTFLYFYSVHCTTVLLYNNCTKVCTGLNHCFSSIFEHILDKISSAFYSEITYKYEKFLNKSTWLSYSVIAAGIFYWPVLWMRFCWKESLIRQRRRSNVFLKFQMYKSMQYEIKIPILLHVFCTTVHYASTKL